MRVFSSLAGPMRVFSSLAPIIRPTYPAVGWILIISFPLLGAVLFLSWRLNVPVGNLTNDIVSVTRTPLYTGMLSSIGILFWTATATLCIFSAMLVTGRQNEVMLKPFLYVSGLFTLLLGFDDLFLLHERVFPNFIGLPEKAVLGSYAVFAVAYLIRFRTAIFETEYPLLGLALSFFGISVVIDAFHSEGRDTAALEDFPKFVGIVSWFVYYARVSTFALHPKSDTGRGGDRKSKLGGGSDGGDPGGNAAASQCGSERGWRDAARPQAPNL